VPEQSATAKLPGFAVAAQAHNNKPENDSTRAADIR
jgi:hypothetical protein